MAQPFTTLTSIAAPLPMDNVDTDLIIPSREMKTTGKTGLAAGLFAPIRYLDADARTPNPDFVLNQPAYAQARILLAGTNFGCGSSREHAVWALAEWGISAIIAPSFAPIFAGNCVRNGVLTVTLPADAIAPLAGQVLTIDLPAQTIAHPGGTLTFSIDPEAKAMLVEGLDAIALTLKRAEAIDAFLAQDRVERPWVYLARPPHRPDGEGNRQAQLGGGGVGRPLPRLRKTNEGAQRARQLRRDMSPPERRLWALLRARPGGFKFRAQHPADPYILDFYCPAARLCIEVDGKSHDDADRQARDAQRDHYLAEHGIETIRISGRDVLHEPDAIIRHIVSQAQERAPLHHDALRHGPPPRSMNREE